MKPVLKTCLVAQLGARMHYAIPRLLHQTNQLEHFYTDTCAVKGWPQALRFVPRLLRSERMERLIGRIPEGVPRSQITAFTNFGFRYAQRMQQALSSSEQTAAALWGGQTFCKKIIERGLGNASAVYAFNSAALELLRRAREEGRMTVVEQTIAPKQIECDWLRSEYQTFPDWEPQLTENPYLAPYIEREVNEWKTADWILCGSEFVRAGIAQCGGPAHRCKVVPYGVDSLFQVPERPPRKGPLRVLTVGEVGLRKGSPYVLAAARHLGKRAEFRMVGPIKASPEAQIQLRKELELTDIVPRSEIVSHFEWADVFLLPSLCEGSATSSYEALACGLPVIATVNSGTVIRDGVEGFIVPPRDSDAVVRALEKLLVDRNLLREMSARARERSAQFDFSAYKSNVLSALQLNSISPESDRPLHAH